MGRQGPTRASQTRYASATPWPRAAGGRARRSADNPRVAGPGAASPGTPRATELAAERPTRKVPLRATRHPPEGAANAASHRPRCTFRRAASRCRAAARRARGWVVPAPSRKLQAAKPQESPAAALPPRRVSRQRQLQAAAAAASLQVPPPRASGRSRAVVKKQLAAAKCLLGTAARFRLKRQLRSVPRC